MSDDSKGPEGQTSPEGQAKKTRNYSEEEFKEVIGQRDEVKKRLRALEEVEAKRKETEDEAARQKAIEEGKIKEVLSARETELKVNQERVKAFEEQMAKLRKTLMSKLTDEVDKDVAKDIQDIDKLTKFVESRTVLTGPYGGKQRVMGEEEIDFQKTFKGRPDDLAKYLREKGLGF